MSKTKTTKDMKMFISGLVTIETKNKETNDVV